MTWESIVSPYFFQIVHKLGGRRWEKTKTVEVLVWVDFKKKFENMYFLRYHRKDKELEFLVLR
jgi:hypothetical protein